MTIPAHFLDPIGVFVLIGALALTGGYLFVPDRLEERHTNSAFPLAFGAGVFATVQGWRFLPTCLLTFALCALALDLEPLTRKVLLRPVVRSVLVVLMLAAVAGWLLTVI